MAAAKKEGGVIQMRPEVQTSAGLEQRTRYNDGWRSGKPEEDPEKLKKWGRVTARPSEFLIHMRRGVVLQNSSGQGASCFKWPWDAVAIVPTTVQRLQFTADQVTSEKVGVQVTGLAVYRIADPIVAFRMLNFSFPERASEKLEHLLCEMFVGAARRLVANLTVEECLSRRKEGIAEELMKEIAPVVGGSGRPDDQTDRGWGVVIDTIEIQDVRVLSPTVFANMQAPYRQQQELRARQAELQREEAVKQRETENARVIALQTNSSESEVRREVQITEEQAKLAELDVAARISEAKIEGERKAQQQRIQLEIEKLAAEQQMRARKQQVEETARLAELNALARLAEAKVLQERHLAAQRAQSEIEKQAAEEHMQLTQMQLESRLQEAKRAQEYAQMQAQLQTEVDRARLEADAQAARHQADLSVAAAQAELERAKNEVASARRVTLEEELKIASLEAQKAKLGHDLEIDTRRQLKDIENTVSEAAISLAVAQQLPQLAAGFAQKMGNVNVTAIDGANPFGFVAAAVEGVMGLARSAGLKVPDATSAPQS